MATNALQGPLLPLYMLKTSLMEFWGFIIIIFGLLILMYMPIDTYVFHFTQAGP